MTQEPLGTCFPHATLAATAAKASAPRASIGMTPLTTSSIVVIPSDATRVLVRTVAVSS